MNLPAILPAGAYRLCLERPFAWFAVVICTAVVCAGADAAIVIQSWDFDSDPGWTISGQWAFGQPTGQGGGITGFFPDPTSGHTGSNVYGVNLNGNYSTAPSPPYYLTTGPIDCSGRSHVALKFWRWLNSDYPSYVYDTVEVSSDGVTWTVLWSNPSYVADGSWTQQKYSISSVADNQAAVYIRWGYHVGHIYQSGIWPCSGWNIDDVEVVSEPPVNLIMAAEPAGGGTTSPAVGGPYVYTQDDIVALAATPNAGYRFDHWTVSAGSQVASPTSASTSVTLDVSKTVTAVFVEGPPVDLTMAVSPPGAGTTDPASGGPYSKLLNEVVSLAATPSDGYRFDHWEVSNGVAVANPMSASTTARMDESKTITAVFVHVELTMAVTPEGSGTTVPPVGGPYIHNHNEVVGIQAAPGPGYAFDHWTVSGGSDVAEPTAASTTVTMDESKTVTAVFVAVELTMAVNRAGAGTTVPATGGPYPKLLNEVVDIAAIPSPGYRFDHWAVSAGSQVVNPTSASTTVTMDRAKTVTAFFFGPEFRGVWVDAFHPGFKSASEIDDLVTRVSQARMNAIIAEVLAYHDTGGGGHGAYWQSNIVPEAAELTGGYDALGYLCNAAHAAGIEVHAWLVSYRVSLSWPPAGNTFLAAHPEYMMVSQADMGTNAGIGGKYLLDPGSPDVQDYLLSIVRELVTRYPIDGIHWDYIRYEPTDSETTDAGYPTDVSYTRSGLARFKQITGYTGTPPPSGEPSWDDFRRREVTELVRRVRAELPTITTNPRQPLRHTAALITWDDAPADFADSRTYKYCFQDWPLWMEKGYLDAGCPMQYDREHCSDQYQWYRNWVDAAVGWRYDRHLFTGQGAYLNGMANSVTQLEYAYGKGVDGTVNYSYYATRANETYCDGSDGWSNDWSWYSYLSDHLFTAFAPTPTMPWRDPATATEGTLYGRVTHSVTGEPFDDVTVQVGSLDAVKTDGSGYYVVTMIPAAGSGTSYTVTAEMPGETLTHAEVTVVAGDVQRNNFFFGPLQPPTIVLHPAGQSPCAGTSVVFTVATEGEGNIAYQWQKNGVALSDDARLAGTATKTLTISNLDPGDNADYRCIASNEAGSVVSDPAALSVQTVPVITLSPESQDVPLHTTATFTVQAEGNPTYQWRKNGVNLTNGTDVQGVTTTQLRILDVKLSHRGTYHCFVTGNCGSSVSGDAYLTINTAPGDIDLDGDVDQADFGALQRCYSGNQVAQTNPACRAAKFDADEDVDGFDLSQFLTCMSGPGTPAELTCLD